MNFNIILGLSLIRVVLLILDSLSFFQNVVKGGDFCILFTAL